MHQFLETYDLPTVNQKETESLNRPITADEMKAIIKKFPAHENSGSDGFTGEFYKTLKEELSHILLRLFQKIQDR